MQHDFIINTENVNGYNYRILTDGIDYTQYERNPVVLYLHDRDSYRNKGTEVIGRCLKLFKKDSQLIATIEFDENEPFAKKNLEYDGMKINNIKFEENGNLNIDGYYK